MADLIIILFVLFSFFGGIAVGVSGTAVPIRDITRDEVVLYCIEKPQLCKEEYDHIKTKENLNNYKRPELGETK